MGTLRSLGVLALLVLPACGGAAMTDDGGTDAGASDLGLRDAGTDAGHDGGTDLGVADLGTDAGPADAGLDACVPLPDDPARNQPCPDGGSCPAGYSCLMTGAGVMTCEVDCSVSACACPTGLACELFSFDGGAAHVCS